MNAEATMEDICLNQDSGRDLRFRGRLLSECSWFDEENGVLTRQKLYVTEDRGRAYHIVRSGGKDERSRHAYFLRVEDDMCVIDNGAFETRLQFDMLMLAVRGLCGIEAGAMPSLDQVEELFRAANA